MNKEFEKIKKDLTTAKSKYTSAVAAMHSKIEKAEADLKENEAKMSAAIETDDQQAYRKYADQCEYNEKRLELLRQKEAAALDTVFSEEDRQRTINTVIALLENKCKEVKQHTEQELKTLSQETDTIIGCIEDASSVLSQITELTGYRDELATNTLRQISYFGANTKTAIDKATTELHKIGF